MDDLLLVALLYFLSVRDIIPADISVIWKEQVVLVVGAASSRDHLILRLEAAPTGVFLW